MFLEAESVEILIKIAWKALSSSCIINVDIKMSTKIPLHVQYLLESKTSQELILLHGLPCTWARRGKLCVMIGYQSRPILPV